MVDSVLIRLISAASHLPVLRHRVATNFQAQAEGMDSDSIITRLLLEDVTPPEPEKASAKQ